MATFPLPTVFKTEERDSIFCFFACVRKEVCRSVEQKHERCNSLDILDLTLFLSFIRVLGNKVYGKLLLQSILPSLSVTVIIKPKNLNNHTVLIATPEFDKVLFLCSIQKKARLLTIAISTAFCAGLSSFFVSYSDTDNELRHIDTAFCIQLSSLHVE